MAVTDLTAQDIVQSIEIVPIDKIIVDQSYQRFEKEAHIKDICDHFGWAEFGVPVLSKRNGLYYDIDGQQRIAAARETGGTEVPALVITGLTKKKEAELFRAINIRRKNLTPLQKFKSALTARDRAALQIKKVLEDEYGLKIGGTNGDPKNLRAITAIQDIHRKGGEAGLRWLMAFLNECWQDEHDWLHGAILRGVWKFHEDFPDVSRTDLTKKLRKILPAQVLRGAKNYLEYGTGGGGGTTGAVALEIKRLYQIGKRKKSL